MAAKAYKWMCFILAMIFINYYAAHCAFALLDFASDLAFAAGGVLFSALILFDGLVLFQTALRVVNYFQTKKESNNHEAA